MEQGRAGRKAITAKTCGPGERASEKGENTVLEPGSAAAGHL